MNIEHFAYDLHSHTFRAASFFCGSLLLLKEERGGQAWNEIAKDVVQLYMNSKFDNKYFTEDKLWSILFDPPQKYSEGFYDLYVFFLANPEQQNFFCETILYAMTDPRKDWWKKFEY